jgi:hypothetical protein
MPNEPSAPRNVVPPDDELNAAFTPYIVAVGEVVNSWNKLQEQLNLVFVAISGMPKDMATSIWHSLRSDSLQRDMLLAAIAAIPQDGRLAIILSNLTTLVKHANELAPDRNNAIHAPVSLALDNGKLVPFPVHFHGNRLAKRLLDKNIILEFNRCRDEANVLKEYADKIETALRFPSYALPDKPALLDPSPTGTRASNPDRQTRKARRKRQSQSPPSID